MHYNLEKELAKTNLETLKINNLYVHSKFNPIRESEGIAIKNYKPHHLHVLFGYGLGYIADKLIKQFQFNEPILIIDPLIDTGLLKVKEHHYKRLYLGNSSNPELLSNILSHLNSYSNKVCFIINPNYDKLFTVELSQVLTLVRDAQVREIYNVNTINKFADQWQLNNLFNIKNVLADKSLAELKKVYDCPIIVASSGPSLTKQIPLLKSNRDKFILICAGSTINVLLKYGIEPDYIVSVDGGLSNYNHFKDLVLQYPKLIYATTNHYKIRNSFKSKGYAFIPTSFRTLKSYFLDNFKVDLTQVIGGGSVAHYSLSIAKLMTTGPIALIGQDLAYTGGISHADGNKGKKRIKDITKKIIEVGAYYEEQGKVQTNDSFNTMIDTFEQMQLAEPHENTVFNCTEGGAKIALYEQISFKTFIEKYCLLPVKRLDSVDKEKSEIDFEKVIKNELDGYKSIKKLLTEGITLTEKERGPRFNQSTLNKLSNIDSKLQKLYKKYNLDSLLEPIVIKNEVKFLPELNETPHMVFKRVKEYTITLYKECLAKIESFEVQILEEMGKQYE